jgi:dihydropteroate synthase
MGVLNVTPDSFYDGGRYFKLEKAIDRGMQIEDEGADILDIGGESTRPLRSGTVASSDEIERVVPVIEKLGRRLTIPISVDTSKAEVAKAALAAGAQIVNDISGFRFDAGMPVVIAALSAAVVLMHSRGTPESMHNLRRIHDVARAVIDGLHRTIHRAVKAGVHRNRMIVDPGLGFGKQAEDNLLLLKKLDKLRALQLPVLVGASRKSFVGKILEVPVGERLSGSLACAALAIFNGAHILRVHDVKETLQVAKICDAVMNSSRYRP